MAIDNMQGKVTMTGKMNEGANTPEPANLSGMNKLFAKKKQENTGKRIPAFFISLGLIIILPLLTFLFGGQIGIGPFLSDIGGRGIALTIVDFTRIIFFSLERFIVEIKLTTV